MKAKLRYAFAIKFARAQIDHDDGIPITMTHPVVQEAVSRYRLPLPSVRRLVSDLRKDRDDRR